MKNLFTNIRGDLFGGVTAGIVALPLALAFGVHSGLGPAAGLYGAIALGFFAALLGGTNTQVSGPTGPMTVISAVVIAEAIASVGSLDSALGIILMTFLLAGAFQILFGIIRIGDYIRFIPYPVVSGFMTGIGIIIILLQVFPIFGQISPSGTVQVIKDLPTLFSHINWYSLLLGGGTVVIVYLFPYITRLIPSQLIALIVMSAIAYYAKMPVPTIGDIPQALPKLQISKIFGFNLLSDYHLVLVPALTLAALGIIDSLLTSVVADNLTKTKHKSNKELVGQGIGNMAAACIGGIPGAGATMRTVVNINAGGRTPLSGIIHSLLLLTFLLGLGGLAKEIPQSVLAGLLICVGIGIIDYKGIKHLLHVPASDSVVMLLVFGMTVFVDLLQAVIVGLILASVLFMKKMSEINQQRTRGETMAKLKPRMTWPKDEPNIPDQLLEHVYIKQLYGPLFFGFTSHFQEMVKAMPEVKHVIIRMGEVPYIDQSGLYAIEDAVLYLQNQGVNVIFTGLQEQPLDMMKRIDLVPYLVEENQCFKTFHDAVKWLSKTEIK